MRLWKFFYRLIAALGLLLSITLANPLCAGARVLFLPRREVTRTVTPSWDERYQAGHRKSEPSKLLFELSRLLPSSGRALDVACGAGRNSAYLAQRGLDVTAVDLSLPALEEGRELARRKNVRVDWVQADLERFLLPSARFDLVVVFYYRYTALYSRLRETLKPGGMLVYQTFTLEQLKFAFGPRNPAHLLTPGELLQVFGDWNVLFYRETSVGQGIASLAARKGTT